MIKSPFSTQKNNVARCTSLPSVAATSRSPNVVFVLSPVAIDMDIIVAFRTSLFHVTRKSCRSDGQGHRSRRQASSSETCLRHRSSSRLAVRPCDINLAHSGRHTDFECAVGLRSHHHAGGPGIGRAGRQQPTEIFANGLPESLSETLPLSRRPVSARKSAWVVVAPWRRRSLDRRGCQRWSLCTAGHTTAEQDIELARRQSAVPSPA